MLSYFSDGETTGNTSAVCSLESIWFQAFLSPLNEQMWLMVKLPGELFASKGSDFDTTIKFNASTGEEYFDQLHVVLKSL